MHGNSEARTPPAIAGSHRLTRTLPAPQTETRRVLSSATAAAVAASDGTPSVANAKAEAGPGQNASQTVVVVNGATKVNITSSNAVSVPVRHRTRNSRSTCVAPSLHSCIRAPPAVLRLSSYCMQHCLCPGSLPSWQCT